MSNVWRTGNKIKINVYCGDRPVCQCHNEFDANEIVRGMNFYIDNHVHLNLKPVPKKIEVGVNDKIELEEKL